MFNRLINKLPFEAHIPGGFRYCGPGTRLAQRLARGDKGINPLDEACKRHDVAYSKSNELSTKHQADRELVQEAKQRLFSKDATLGERTAAGIFYSTVGLKEHLGMGVKRKRKTRKIPIAKRGGFLIPLAAGAFGVGSSLYNTFRGLKHNQKMLQEQLRHNQLMETLRRQGKGLYMRPYKRGRGVKKSKRQCLRKKKKYL